MFPALPLAPDATPALEGGAVCLAFVNSVWWRRSTEPKDQLTGYDAVVGHVAARLGTELAGEVRRAASENGGAAGRALHRAIELRESMHAVFTAVADGSAPGESDLAVVDSWVNRAAARLHLVADSGTFTLRIEPGTTPGLLDLPMYEVALSAAALLTSDQLDRVRACPGPTCGWLFVDTTRNGSRRWCDPAQCGNRERVRAHYQRTHAAR